MRSVVTATQESVHELRQLGMSVEVGKKTDTSKMSDQRQVQDRQKDKKKDDKFVGEHGQKKKGARERGAQT